jgi:hypothetical protein
MYYLPFVVLLLRPVCSVCLPIYDWIIHSHSRGLQESNKIMEVSLKLQRTWLVLLTMPTSAVPL